VIAHAYMTVSRVKEHTQTRSKEGRTSPRRKLDFRWNRRNKNRRMTWKRGAQKWTVRYGTGTHLSGPQIVRRKFPEGLWQVTYPLFDLPDFFGAPPNPKADLAKRFHFQLKGKKKSAKTRAPITSIGSLIQDAPQIPPSTT
jgi:hypothetical protein